MIFTDETCFRLLRGCPSPRFTLFKHFRPRRRRAAMPLLIALLLLSTVQGPTAHGQSSDTPMTRLRPITAPSAVDEFYRQSSRGDGNVAAAQVVTAQWQSIATNPVVDANRSPETQSRHTARMQFQFPAGPAVPTTAPPIAPADASTMAPPSLGPSAPPVSGTVLTPTMPPVSPTVAPPRGLPMGPGPVTTSPMTIAPNARSSSDLLPVAPPQLNDQFATISNCSCVSPPSSYVAATGWTQNATPAGYTAAPPPSAYIAPPSQVTAPAVIAAPAVIPDASTMPKGSGVPRHSVINFGQTRNPVVVGQGIVGQPVAYVPGQPVRNWIRYLFP